MTTDLWRYVPLAGTLLFLLLGIGVRELIQRRRYGISGLAIVRDGARVENLIASLGLFFPVLLLAQAVLTAVAPHALDAWRVPLPEVAKPVGALLLFGGTVLMFVAQMDMGASWRIGLDFQKQSELVTGGMYRVSRNPIYLCMFVTLAGFALLVSTWPVWLALSAGCLCLRAWVVHVEEAELLGRYGDGYRTYAAHVGRFLPWFGRLR